MGVRHRAEAIGIVSTVNVFICHIMRPEMDTVSRRPVRLASGTAPRLPGAPSPPERLRPHVRETDEAHHDGCLEPVVRGHPAIIVMPRTSGERCTALGARPLEELWSGDYAARVVGIVLAG
jgi:hypothetical protein